MFENNMSSLLYSELRNIRAERNRGSTGLNLSYMRKCICSILVKVYIPHMKLQFCESKWLEK